MLDTLIRNATIVDGTGGAPYRASVGLQDGRIAEIGALEGAQAAEAVAADGLVLAPGFIDIHTHSDMTLLAVPDCLSMVQQGTTTMVGGNCGFSMVPGEFPTFAEYFGAIEREGISANFCTYVGHGTIRRAVMGLDSMPPTPEQMAGMRKFVARSLEEGVVGLSSGLIYVPSMYGDVAELSQAARVLQAYDGVYTSHIRGEGETVFAAVAEAIEVGRRTGLRVQISHLKMESSLMWGRAEELLDLIRRARQEGLRINVDQYPYAAYA
ncbi:MAG: D-aminoacylase, partial [Firmicutes bacterium]|nr:D-aminoacylase [Bacillota bacterium]